MQQSWKNRDCRNYAPVDVAKGMCHKQKILVLADDPACDKFDQLPKCEHCLKFSPGEEEHLGTCTASPNQPMTYPDLISVTCEWFSWKKA